MENHCFGDIIFEILTRLPTKSLMRFNCVSKTWNTLIRHDPNFVKSHTARSQARPTATRLLFQLEVLPDNQKDVAVKENKKQRIEEFPLELLAPRHHYFNYKDMRICSNHCNGLICLYSLKDTRVYLLNVTTREIKALSFSVNDVKSPLYPPRLCLGFDSVMEKYKLLQVFVENNNNKRVTKMRIRTLGPDSYWRNCCCMPWSVSDYIRCNFLNGVLYWALCSRSRIFYFDLSEEELRSFPLPEGYSHFAVLDCMQTALRGKLLMQCYNAEFKPIDCIYDELNKVFTKFKYHPNYFCKEKMFAFLEAEKIVKLDQFQVLATTSIIDADTYLVVPYPFLLAHASSFVENIVPLSFLV